MTFVDITFFLVITLASATNLSASSSGGEKDFRTVEFKDNSGVIISLSYDADYNPIYTSPAYFGSNDQGGSHSSFVIDTTSPYLTITSKECDNCSS